MFPSGLRGTGLLVPSPNIKDVTKVNYMNAGFVKRRGTQL